MHNVYSVRANVTAELSKNFQTIISIKPWAEHLEIVQTENISMMGFREKVDLYISNKESMFSLMNIYDKDVINAVEILGIDEIRRLNYHKGNIKKKLISKSNISESNKIFLLLNNKLVTGETYSKSQVKEILTGIYNSLDITKKATATQIDDYFECLLVATKINGENFKGYKIIRPKVVFH